VQRPLISGADLNGGHSIVVRAQPQLFATAHSGLAAL
jgi:hypothetical protein